MPPHLAAGLRWLAGLPPAAPAPHLPLFLLSACRWSVAPCAPVCATPVLPELRRSHRRDSPRLLLSSSP
ncbi:hypothetical protein U1Q18_014994, partial [Sarracenia purpurea var. burkii]